MSECQICHETIDTDDITIKTSCCENIFHSDCFIQAQLTKLVYHGLYNQQALRINCPCSIELCSYQPEVTLTNMYNNYTTTEYPGELITVENNENFKKAVKILVQKRSERNKAKKEFETKLRQTKDTFFNDVNPIIENLKNLHTQTKQQIKESNEYKQYVNKSRHLNIYHESLFRKFGLNIKIPFYAKLKRVPGKSKPQWKIYGAITRPLIKKFTK